MYKAVRLGGVSGGVMVVFYVYGFAPGLKCLVVDGGPVRW